MLVGVAREVINPELGHSLCGYGDYPNTGVHDDISVTALFLDDGTRQAILLSYDLIGLRAATLATIRNSVSQATGVPAAHVFAASTHVHSAPACVTSWVHVDSAAKEQYKHQDYLDRLEAWSVKAAVAAKGNGEECDLRYNFTYADENMNRRYNFPDRRFLYIPANKQLLGTSKEYVDRELGIVAFRRKGTLNRYKAVITNYTAHPLCVGNSSNLVSADFQGVLRRRVEETFADCLCLSTTGAAGDNHPLMPEGGFATAEAMGTALGRQTIARCYDAVAVDYDTQLRLAYPEVLLPWKDMATVRMLPEKEARAGIPSWIPTNTPGMPTYLSLLGIGPILLAGFPGEVVAELGAMLKWSSPFLKSYVLFTSTDCLGYFPVTNQFYWGGYEPTSTGYVRGAGEMMVRRVVEAAAQLLADQPLNYRAGFRPAPSLSFNSGVRLLTTGALTPQLQLNVRWDGRETGANADHDNSGGTSVYLTPGVTLDASARSHVFAFLQVSVYQRVNGLRITPRWLLSVGLRYDL